MNRHLILFTLIALAGCAGANTNYDGLVKSWVGASDTDLRRNWGEPTKTNAGDARTVMVYETRRVLHVPGTVAYTTGMGTATTPGTAPMDLALYCATTFEVESGVVVASSYVGNGCASTVAAHVRR